MNMNRVYVVVVSSLVILFCLVYQGTYSYYSVGFNDSRDNKDASLTTTDLQDLTMVSSSSETSDILIPGESVISTFKVTNPSSASLCFNLIFDDVVNTFVNTNDLEVTLKDSKDILLGQGVFPTSSETVFTKVLIPKNTEETYTLTVLYKNTDEDQLDDRGKSFSANISGELTTCSP